MFVIHVFWTNEVTTTSESVFMVLKSFFSDGFCVGVTSDLCNFQRYCIICTFSIGVINLCEHTISHLLTHQWHCCHADTSIFLVHFLVSSHFLASLFYFILFCSCRSNPCQYMVPILEEVVPELEAVSEIMKDKIEVVRIDTDKYSRVADYYRIEALPTFIIFINGKSCDRFVSLDNSSLDAFLWAVLGYYLQYN